MIENTPSPTHYLILSKRSTSGALMIKQSNLWVNASLPILLLRQVG